MGAERRQFLRVLFEETIEIRTAEWSDPVATGLDVSLNGVRFHCENSLSDGETVTIGFRPDFELEGKVRWCWPIEWYYQAAVQFVEITPDEQERLRDYIMSVTGEDYPIEEGDDSAPAESAPAAQEEYLELDEQAPALVTEFAPGDLSPMAYAGKIVMIMSEQEEQAGTLKRYLTERCGFESEVMSKKHSLWRMMKLDPVDVTIMEWYSHDPQESIDAMLQTKEQFPETSVIFLGGSVSLETRLHAINQGATDFLTQPVSLASVAQSVLKTLAQEQAPGLQETDAVAATIAATPLFSEEELSENDLLEEDFDLGDELELIDEDF